jgi:hypothetical protein
MNLALSAMNESGRIFDSFTAAGLMLALNKRTAVCVFICCKGNKKSCLRGLTVARAWGAPLKKAKAKSPPADGSVYRPVVLSIATGEVALSLSLASSTRHFRVFSFAADEPPSAGSSPSSDSFISQN